jgi:integrase
MSLKLVRRPKSPNFVIRGSIGGHRVEESTGTSDRRTAEEIRAKREAEIHRGQIYGREATATFAEAALSYLENGGSRKFIEPVIKHFGTKPLAKIDYAAIEAGSMKVYPNVAPSTRNRQFFTPTVAILNYGAMMGLCAKPVVRRPKSPEGRIRWITIEEADRLIEAAADHMKPLITFLLYTGARTGEALWLDWRDVNLGKAHVTFGKTKNGEPRGVPLHDRVIPALANIKHRSGEVFRRPDGKLYARSRSIDDTSAGSRIKTAFKAACRRAGIEDFHPHDCRHTWATWHYQANRDLGALMKLGGWKSVKMVMRYAHTNVDELSHTIDKLPGGNLGELKVVKGGKA